MVKRWNARGLHQPYASALNQGWTQGHRCLGSCIFPCWMRSLRYWKRGLCWYWNVLCSLHLPKILTTTTIMSARSSFSLKTCLLKKMKRHIKKNNPKLHSRKSDFRKKTKNMQIRKTEKNATENAKNDLFFSARCLLSFCMVLICFPCFYIFSGKNTTKKHGPFLLFVVLCFFELFFLHLFFVCFCFLCFPIACVLHLLGDPVLHLLFSNSSFFAVCLLFFSSAFFLRIILSGWHKTATSIQLTLPNRYCTL